MLRISFSRLPLLRAVEQKIQGPNDSYAEIFAEDTESVFNMIARMDTPNERITVRNIACTVTFNVSSKRDILARENYE